MKQIKYECLKFLTSLQFIIVTCSIIIVGAISFFAVQIQNPDPIAQNTKRFSQIITSENMVSTLKDKAEEYTFYTSYYNLLNNGTVDSDQQVLEINESRMTSYQQAITDLGIDKIYEEQRFYVAALEYTTQVAMYPNFVQSVIDKYEDNKSMPFYSKYSTQQKVQLENIVDKYRHQENAVIELSNYPMVEATLSDQILFITMLLTSVFSSYFIFHAETKLSMGRILFTTKKGISSFLKSKLIATLFIVNGLLFIAFSLNLLISTLIYSGVDPNATVQSIPMFYESPYTISILAPIGIQYFMYSVGVSFFILLYFTLFKYLRSVVTVTIICSIFIISSLILGNIQSNTTFEWIRQLSFTRTFLNIQGVINYSYIDIFNRIISFRLLSSLFYGVLTLILLFLFLSKPKNSLSSRPAPRFNLTWNTNIFKNMTRSRHILYQYLLQYRFLIIAIIVLIFQSYFYSDFHLSKYKVLSDQNREIATEFYERGGIINRDTEDYLNTVATEFEHYRSDVDEIPQLSRKGELNSEDIHLRTQAYADYYRENLGRVKLLESYNNESSSYLAYTEGFELVTARQTFFRDFRFSLLFIVFISLLSSISISKEAERSEDELYQTMKHNVSRINNRNLIILTTVFSVFIIACFVELYSIHTLYPMRQWMTPIGVILSDTAIQNLPFFLKESTSIWFYTLLLYLTRMLGVLIFTCSSIIISKRSKSIIGSLVILLLITIIPLLLYVSGFTSFSYVGIFSLISGNLILQDPYLFIFFLLLIFLIPAYLLISCLMNKVLTNK